MSRRVYEKHFPDKKSPDKPGFVNPSAVTHPGQGGNETVTERHRPIKPEPSFNVVMLMALMLSIPDATAGSPSLAPMHVRPDTWAQPSDLSRGD